MISILAFLACAPKYSLEEALVSEPLQVSPQFVVRETEEEYRGGSTRVFYKEDENGCVVEKRIEGNTSSAFLMGHDFTIIYAYTGCSSLPSSLLHIDYAFPILLTDEAIAEPFIRDPTDIVMEQYKETYQRDAEGCLTRMEVLTGDRSTYLYGEDGKVKDIIFHENVVYDWVQYFLIDRSEGLLKLVIGEIDPQGIITGGVIATFDEYNLSSDCTILKYRDEDFEERPFNNIVNKDIIKDSYLLFKGEGKRHDNPHGKYTLATLPQLIQPQTNISIEAP